MPTRLRKFWLFTTLLLFCGWLLAQNLFSNRASSSGYGQFRPVPAVGLVDQPTPTSPGSAPSSLDARAFGVKCDGSSNDSASLQSAINAANNGTTPSLVILPPGTCLANVTLPTGVVISGGMQYFSVYAHNWGKPTTILKTADKTGATAVVSVVNNAVGAGVVGLELYGRGSGTGDRGVYIPHGSRIYVGPNVACDNFGEECVRWESGTSLYVQDVYAINSLLNRRTTKSGVLYINGSDYIVRDSEFGSSNHGGVTSTHLYLTCIALDANANNGWIRDTVAEFCDEGLWMAPSNGTVNNRIIGLRADHNFGHGVEVGGWYNQFVGVFSEDSSLSNNNTYDAFYITGKGNTFTGSLAQAYTTNKYRYGYNDQNTDATLPNRIVNSPSYSHQTAAYVQTTAYVDVIGSACPGCTTGAALVIASGTSRLTNGAIGSGGCATTLTATAAGTRTTDAIKWSYAGAPTIADSMLILSPYVTADHVNFVLCNPTAKNLLPSGLVVNWEVLR